LIFRFTAFYDAVVIIGTEESGAFKPDSRASYGRPGKEVDNRGGRGKYENAYYIVGKSLIR